jgi:ABC-2 type transport system ATP-binding protein
LLKAIAGIIPPSRGSVKTIGHIAPMIELGAGFRSDLNSIENTILYGRLLGIKLDVLRSNVNTIIEWAGLSDRKTDPLSTFSSGMLARLAFSISSFGNPNILLIDEILSVGDRDFQKKSRERIRHLMNSGTTVLLVSHDLATIESTCIKTIWIEAGEIQKYGETTEVLKQYASE